MTNAVLPISDIKGSDGYSPTITVKTDTSSLYVLTIKDVNGSYNTPNLKGSGGGSTPTESDFFLGAHPVGSIYISMTSSNPSNTYGGTWTQIAQGRTLVGVDTTDSRFNTADKTGGSYEQTLRAKIGAVDNELSKVGYDVTAPVSTQYASGIWSKGTEFYSGSISQINHNTDVKQDNNEYPTTIQPYLTTYFWKRTA